MEQLCGFSCQLGLNHNSYLIQPFVEGSLDEFIHHPAQLHLENPQWHELYNKSVETEARLQSPMVQGYLSSEMAPNLPWQ